MKYLLTIVCLLAAFWATAQENDASYVERGEFFVEGTNHLVSIQPLGEDNQFTLEVYSQNQQGELTRLLKEALEMQAPYMVSYHSINEDEYPDLLITTEKESFIFLYNKETPGLHQLQADFKLVNIKPFADKPPVFYTYDELSCGGNLWQSVMFMVEGTTIQQLGCIHGDECSSTYELRLFCTCSDAQPVLEMTMAGETNFSDNLVTYWETHWDSRAERCP